MKPQPVSTEASRQYGGLFRRTLSRAVRRSLNDVRAHRHIVQDEVREQAWHMLKLLFEGNELWVETGQLLIELAPRMEMAGFREDWIPFLESGITRSIERNDHLTEARLRLYLGQLYRHISQWEEARAHLQASMSIFASLDKPEEQAKCLNELAYLSWQRGNVNKTIGYAEKALSLLPDDHIDAAMAYSALGQIVTEQKHYNKAETYFRQALAIREQHQDDRLIAWSLQNLSVALMYQGQYSKALIEFGRAKKMLESIGDLAHLGVVHLNIGLTLHHAGEYLQALEYSSSAESILSPVGDVRHLARLSVNRGLSLYALDRFSEAEQCFERAITLFTTLKNDALRLNATDGVIMAKIAQEQMDEAETLLTSAMQELETMPELPNFAYLTDSFANRKQIIQGSRE